MEKNQPNKQNQAGRSPEWKNELLKIIYLCISVNIIAAMRGKI